MLEAQQLLIEGGKASRIVGVERDGGKTANSSHERILPLTSIQAGYLGHLFAD